MPRTQSIVRATQWRSRLTSQPSISEHAEAVGAHASPTPSWLHTQPLSACPACPGFLLHCPYSFSFPGATVVNAQNRLTQLVLAQCTTRGGFKDLFTRLYNYPRFSVPFRRGRRIYYSHNSGLQAQSVIYTQADLEGEPSVLIDPNTLSEDGTVALMGWSFSGSWARDVCMRALLLCFALAWG
jgi:hypothetical protein